MAGHHHESGAFPAPHSRCREDQRVAGWRGILGGSCWTRRMTICGMTSSAMRPNFAAFRRVARDRAVSVGNAIGPVPAREVTVSGTLYRSCPDGLAAHAGVYTTKVRPAAAPVNGWPFVSSKRLQFRARRARSGRVARIVPERVAPVHGPNSGACAAHATRPCAGYSPPGNSRARLAASRRACCSCSKASKLPGLGATGSGVVIAVAAEQAERGNVLRSLPDARSAK
jgi:hypothetical protein